MLIIYILVFVSSLVATVFNLGNYSCFCHPQGWWRLRKACSHESASSLCVAFGSAPRNKRWKRTCVCVCGGALTGRPGAPHRTGSNELSSDYSFTSLSIPSFILFKTKFIIVCVWACVEVRGWLGLGEGGVGSLLHLHVGLGRDLRMSGFQDKNSPAEPSGQPHPSFILYSFILDVFVECLY